MAAAWLLHGRIVANDLVICRNSCGGHRIRLVALIYLQQIFSEPSTGKFGPGSEIASSNAENFPEVK
jgi:hypothetical protein